MFEKLDSGLEAAFDYELPLVGISLNDIPALGFLDDLASSGTSALCGALTSPQSVRNALQSTLSSAFPGASVSVVMIPANPTNSVEYAVSLDQTLTEQLPLDADLGFPGLNLDIDADVDVAFDWSFDFTIGASVTDGVYLGVNQSPELQIDLGLSLAPGSTITGELGFLQLTIVDDPLNPTMLSGSFEIDLLDPGTGVANDGKLKLDELAEIGPANLTDLVDVLVGGNAAAHLDLALSSVYDLSDLPLVNLPRVSLPTILSDFEASWNLAQLDNPTVKFTNNRLDLGSFFAGFGGQALDAINQALDPIRPVLDVLTRRIPVLSDIGAVVNALDQDGDGNVTLLDAAVMLGGVSDTRMITGLAHLADLIDAITDVNTATGGNNGFLIPLPDLVLTGQGAQTVGGLDQFQVPSSIDTNFDLTGAINTLPSNVATPANQFVQMSNQAPSGFDMSLPFLKKPSSLMGLLLGRDVELIRVDLPALDMHFSIERSFPIFFGINGIVAGSLDIHADLAYGYDTLGIRQFKDSGYSDRSKLANGFFIMDRVDGQGNPSTEGTDAPEVKLTGTISVRAGTGLPAGIIASVLGDITADVLLDLPDGNQTVLADGRSRFDELSDCGINVNGKLTAGLGAKVVLEIPFAPDITLFKKSIARATLLDFSAGCVVPTPLATLASGVLTINVGTSQDEKVAVSAAKDKNGVDVVRVQMFGVAQEFPRAQVQSFVANFGDGDDSIYIDPQLTIPAIITGGTGNDSLAGGGGDDNIQGGDGDDEIAGGLGNDFLFGGIGNDQLEGDDGGDVLRGDDGNDTLHGGAGADHMQGDRNQDTVLGGEGDDILFGDSEADDTIRGDDALEGGTGNDTLVGGPGVDTISGNDGDDFVRGDTASGTVPVPVGVNDDSLYGDAGIDTIEGGVGIDLIFGGADNDLLFGQSVVATGDDAAADQLFGDGGDDQLFGQNGADLLQGDLGNDQLFGGNDADALHGYLGDDQLHGGSGNDQLFGGEDDDLLEGDAGADTLHGDEREDLLYGHSISGAGDDAAADILFGDQGEDELHGNAGNDALQGGTNDDQLFGDAGNDTLEGDAGADELHGGANDDVLFGHSVIGVGDDAAMDTLFGDDGDDTAHGNAGDDLIHGNNNSDTLYGDAGQDVIEGNTGVDTMFGGAGTDQLFGQSVDGSGEDNAGDTLYGDFGTGHPLGGTGDPLVAGRDEIFGQGGNDQIFGEEFADEIHGGTGVDTIHGGAANDFIDGGAGADQLFGDAGNDRIHGGLDGDTISGGSENDEIYGNDGNDVIQGDAGADRLFGDAGEDQLFGGLGADLLVAGAGIVNRLFGDEDDDQLVGSDEGTEDPNPLDTDFFGDILVGGAGDDRIFGLGGADDIDGSAGDDWVDGGVRGDYIRGNSGRDVLYGAQGNDLIEGNDDNDQLFGEEGMDTLRGDEGNDFLDGGVDADMLFGGADQDEIHGGGSVGDQLFGEAGADVLHGSDDGADIAQGGPGRDRIDGHGGNDTLRGGDDDDTLLGGLGDDLLEGEAGSDVLAGQENHDTLHGHNSTATGDDNKSDHLYGDFATNDDEAGSGRDRLFGNGGNDFLFGEADDDFLDAGAGTNDTLDFGAGDGGTPNNFVPPTPTAPPAVLPHVPHERTDPSLASGITERGRWQQFAGSATGLGLAGNIAGAIDPSIVTSTSGQIYAAWSDGRNGNYEIYVSRWNGTAWQGLAGSHEQGGVSNTLDTSQKPSIALNASGQPIVTWAEGSDIFVSQFDPAANGGMGAWVALANSLNPGGISGTGTADAPIIVNTASGPAIAWLNRAAGVTEIRVQQFNGSAWVAVGTTVAASAPDTSSLSDLAYATDGTKQALAWSQSVAGVARVFALEFAGTAWQELAGSATGSGISPSTLPAAQPTIAYHGGTLYAAWQQLIRAESNESEIYAARFIGTAWEAAGAGALADGGVSSTAGTASRPHFAVGGNVLHLAWVEDLRSSDVGDRTTIYSTRWDGTSFIERFNQSGDTAGGITGTGNEVRDFSMHVNASGHPFVAWSHSDAGSPQVYVRGDTLATNRVMYTSAGISLQTITEGNTLQPGDIIVVTPNSEIGPVTLTAAHSGIVIVGTDEGQSRIDGLLTFDGVNNVTIARVDLAGGLSATMTTDLDMMASRIGGTGLYLDGTTRTRIVNSTITSTGIGLVLNCNVDALLQSNAILGSTAGVQVLSDETGSRIVGNAITSAGTGLDLDAQLIGGVVQGNTIQGIAIGVDYSSAAELVANRIHGSAIGVRVAAGQTLASNVPDWSDLSDLSDRNHITANAVGVHLLGTMTGQVIRGNMTGVTGSGTLGPDNLDDANLIYRNTTGVDFTGTIQFNRIDANVTGVKAKGNSQITHNQFADNTSAGILANNMTGVQIANNVMVAAVGDNIRIENLAREIEVRGNSLWVDSGTDIYVADNARSGFFSDYNQLHATGTGKLVHWMRDFTDILDWQLDVNVYDLHSIGTTVANPLGTQPVFESMARGDYRMSPIVGSLRTTSPGVDAADPRNDVGVPPSFVNLLANPSFESGITGWTTNVGGTAGAPNATPFHGSAYYVPGALAAGVAEQTINLTAAGFTTTQLDSQNLTAIFGGRVRSKSETPIDTATITIEFKNGGGTVLSSQTRTAANVGDRWDLVGDRLAIPVGARQITYRFESIRFTGTSNDAHLDNAFVYLQSEAVSPDHGAYGNTDFEPIVPAAHLTLTYPDLYIDWQRDGGKTIRWQSYNNSLNSPVRIDLMQDGVHGPQFVTTIAAATPDDGEFVVIPVNLGVNFDTTGLRVQISLANDSITMDQAQEAFTVPDNSTTFFVDDASNTNDEYTPTSTGSNRNTGKTASAPKPHPVNLLRAYDLPAGSVVSIDTGTYPLFDAIRLSGTFDLGLGLEEGFTLRGPTDTAKHVAMSWIYPDNHPQALVELNDADFMTLTNLDVTGSQRGLWVTGASDNFAASFITARNQTLDAIDITPLNPAANFVGLVAENAGRHGIVITGDFTSLTDGRAANNVDTGVKLTNSGNAHIEAMDVFGNRIGIDVSNPVAGTQTVVGNMDLSLGRGNKVRDNSLTGIQTSAFNGTVLVAGNTVHGHRTSMFGAGIQVNGTTQVDRNVVFDNQKGITAAPGIPVRENRVYGNLNTGITAGGSSQVVSNVVYDNPIGITLSAPTGQIANNLIYDNPTTGLKLSGGNSPDVVNNTIHVTTGNGLRAEAAVQNLELRNNIVWADGGTGISIANDSQTALLSDFNLLFASGTGVVGSWLGTSQPTLQQWQLATGKDANSLSNDPLFVDLDGTDNVLGFVLNGVDGSDDDFHLQSPFGSVHGGSLAPVRSGSTGLPVFPVGTLTNDALLSPGIDRGAVGDSFANEPSPNGGFINIGYDGNTAQASRSPSPLLLALDPNGGEIVPQGSTFPVRWRASGFSGNVKLEVSSTGAGGPFQTLAASEPNDGAFDWLVNAGTFPVSNNYVLRISSVDQPSVIDLSDAPFQVTIPTTTYYVNDNSLTGDEYTTAVGAVGNTGESADSPLLSIQAVLDTRDLGPGDVIFVDTGSYSITTNIVIDAADSGVRIQGPVQGTHVASLNRNNTATGSHVFQLQNATNVTLDSLEIFGANEAVFVNLASHDFTISNSIVRNNTVRGIHIEDTAHRAVIADNDMHSHLNSNSFAVEIEGDEAVIRNNTIRNNTSATGINVTSTAANTLIRENDVFGNATAIQTNQPSNLPSGLRIEANSVHGNNGNTAINVIGAGLVIDNDVFANPSAIVMDLNGNFVEARGNTVHGNLITGNGSRAMRLSSGATARGNRIFGNALIGIETSSSNVFDNVIYANATGIFAGFGTYRISNNVIYANSAFGIDHTFNANTSIINNTIVQSVGDAIRHTAFATGNPSVVNVLSNVLVVAAGSALNITAGIQPTFTSDYNLFHLTGTGKTATWGTTPIPAWQDFQFATGRDTHSIQADPLFVDPDGPDNVLGNDDDDFHVQPGSPTLDAGHPLGIYSGEPASGNRADLGAYGNSGAALATTGQRIQLVEPATFQKVEVGQPVDVRWVTSGLTNPAPVLLLNAGGSSLYDAVSGRWSAEAYRRGFSQVGSFTQSVDVSGVTNPPPASVLQDFAQLSNTGNSFPMRYDVPLADGSYQIRLFFVDPTASAANQRRFNVTLQGQTVLSNYDIFADAGAIRKAVVKTFNFTASQGTGLNLEIVNGTTGFGIVNAFEITRVDAAAPTSFAVNLEFSPNDGQTWSTIATNLPSNRFGEGQFTWTAMETTEGHAGNFRATPVGSGVTAAPVVSSRAISVASPTNSFYVNATGDSNFSDNEYTTAAGNDFNSGTSPASPLASLSLLLKNYDLGPGDTVYVDSGTYNLQDNLVIGAIHSGVRIQGPVAGSHAAVINRGSTASGNYAIHLQDATNVTLDSLELVGANEGLRIEGASHDATLSNSIVQNNFVGVRVASPANRATISQNDIHSNTGSFSLQEALIVEGDDALIENNLIHNNAGAAVRTDLGAADAVLRGNDIFEHPTFAIDAQGTNGLIEQNLIHGNATSVFVSGAVQIRQATVQDNQIFGNSRPGIALITSGAIVQRNVIHDNTDGIANNSSGVALIRDNRIFHNASAGIRLLGPGATVTGNSIYSNSTGVIHVSSFGSQTTTIANNVINDHASAGIEVNSTSTSTLDVVAIHNNTVFEPNGTAVRLLAGLATDARNNILSTATGTVFNVANAAQAGFTSDYNLLQVSGSGKVGLWGNDSIVNRADWYFELGRDEHSIEADPQFIDIDGPDGRRGYDVATSTDFGADDNFLELTGSPAVDAGDPLFHYSAEPVSGSRINLGAYGNTATATASSALRIQLTAPVGLGKFEVGQAIPINWLSSGFTTPAPVALINAGGIAVSDFVSGRWGVEAFRTGGTTGTITGTIDTSLLTTPAPSAVLSTFSGGILSQIGVSTRYDVPVPDGNYHIRLLFVEPTANGPNQRKFDVQLQGQTVLANYDVFADAGAIRKAVAKSFAFTATQGTGLNLELINRTSNGAILSGIEVTAVNAAAPETFAANLEFSADNGATWTTIAQNVPANRFGDGSFTWTANQTTTGNTGRFRVTAVSSGVPSIQNVIAQPISIANSGTAYYVNIAGDANLANNEYTTASGDNLNTGKSPNSPMKSLGALVRAYDLDAGDTVFIDAGSYEILTNVVLGSADSGVTFQGPVLAGQAASITRDNTAVGNYVLDFVGGVSGIVVDSLEVLGAEDGIHLTNGTNIEIRDSILRNNANRGVYVETTGSNVRILNNQIQENTSRGVEVRGTLVTIEDNLIRNSDKGVLVTCCSAGNVTIRDNDIFGHSMGVDLSPAMGSVVVQGNKIHDNATHGINALIGGTAVGQIIGNEVFGQSGSGDFGIVMSAPNNASLTVRDNLVHHNFTGVSFTGSGGVLQHNWIYSNTSVGINITANNTPEIRDNQIYSNATGMIVNPTFTSFAPQIRNNLVYSNTNIGIDVSNGSPGIVGNTIVHPVGTAVRFTGAGTGTLKNNIVLGNVGTLVSVATGGQAAFVSDRNDLFPTSGAANVGLWGAMTATTLANWQAMSGRDASSISADPLFLDIDGADNVLGEQGVPEGNGFDDNFGLRANSPAIDRGDGFHSSATDLLGRTRQDDPATANNGSSQYVENAPGSNQFTATGTAMNFRGDNSLFTLSFSGGFAFPFYGMDFTSVFVSTNGLLQFGNSTNGTDATNTTSELLEHKRIAPLWDDFRTDQTGDDIFVDTTVAGTVKISWNASRVGDNSDVQFAVTLVNTGEIQFHYGPGNTNLTPTVGISAGDGFNFDLAQYDGQSSLGNANSLSYTLVPGFVDLGAYEFQGDSGDVTPPTVTGVQPAGIFAGGIVPSTTNSIAVSFSEPVDLLSALSPALYQLIGDGLDQQFDTGDDVVIGITSVAYTAGSLNATLALSQALPTDRYRLTLMGRVGQSHFDQAGNRLDGDANGSAGGDFVRIFNSSTTVGPAIDTNAAPNQVAENSPSGTLVGVTALAVDPDATDTVTYSLDDNAGGRFQIDPMTGVVSVAPGGPGLLNGETAAAHDITVRATSNDGSFSTSLFTIAVTDVDEFDVGPVTDTNAASDSVIENAASGTPVGLTAFASDADATTNTIIYSLTDNSLGRFAIDPVTGVVTVVNGTLIDREQAASYNVTVRGTSADGSFSEQVFTIAVLDVDEFNVGPITDTNPANDRVDTTAAVGAPVGITAFASDADATNSAITYTLENNADGRFAMDPVTGVITVAGQLNDPPATNYDIVVRATSADGSSSTRVFSIAVLAGGDFDGDGDLDLGDVDALSTAIATGSGNLLYDVTGDGQLTLADLQRWVLEIKGTLMGDSNLDFVVDGQDFIRWNSFKFTTSTLWSQGNFNADGFVDGQDFIIWNSNKFMTASRGNMPAPALESRSLTTEVVFAGIRRSREQRWTPDQDADDYFAQLEIEE